MKQTNYYLFDFMDFDPTLQKDEALWKAYAPSDIQERDGDIVVTIPYQQQKRQEDMAPDETIPQQTYDLIIRAYEPDIIRLFTTMTDDTILEQDDMLQFSPDVKRLPLRDRRQAKRHGEAYHAVWADSQVDAADALPLHVDRYAVYEVSPRLEHQILEKMLAKRTAWMRRVSRSGWKCEEALPSS